MDIPALKKRRRILEGGRDKTLVTVVVVVTVMVANDRILIKRIEEKNSWRRERYIVDIGVAQYNLMDFSQYRMGSIVIRRNSTSKMEAELLRRERPKGQRSYRQGYSRLRSDIPPLLLCSDTISVPGELSKAQCLDEPLEWSAKRDSYWICSSDGQDLPLTQDPMSQNAMSDNDREYN